MKFPAVFACLVAGFGVLVAGCSSDPRQTTPVLAYTVIQHAVFDLTKSESDFADTLTKYFGIPKSEGLDVIAYAASKNTRDQVNADALAQLEKSLRELQTKNPDKIRRRLEVEVVAPYLQFVMHRTPIDSAIRRDIEELYGRVVSQTAPNGLRALRASLTSYQTGGSFHVDSLELFNQQMRAQGRLLQLNLSTKQVCLLNVIDTILDRQPWESKAFSVIKVRRHIPCFLGFELGYSSLRSNTVVVVADKLGLYAEGFARQRDPALTGRYYQDLVWPRVWQSLGLKLGFQEANHMVYTLVHREFAALDSVEIAKRLEIEVSIHEAKHKADEIDLPAMNINFDSEVSAHLTQAIFGQSPFHSLVDAIGRIEGFYKVSGDAAMGSLVVKLWGLAILAQDSSYSQAALRAGLLEVYAGYVTESSRTTLPNLDKFGAVVVPAIITGVRRER